MKKMILLCIILIVVIAACKEYATNPKCAVFDSHSVIEELIPNPTAADLFFTVANFEALESELYTKAQVETFFDELERLAYIEGITLSDLAFFAMRKIESLRGSNGRRILLASMYLEQFQAQVVPVSAKDQCLIGLHIDNQRKKILALF